MGHKSWGLHGRHPFATPRGKNHIAAQHSQPTRLWPPQLSDAHGPCIAAKSLRKRPCPHARLLPQRHPLIAFDRLGIYRVQAHWSPAQPPCILPAARDARLRSEKHYRPPAVIIDRESRFGCRTLTFMRLSWLEGRICQRISWHNRHPAAMADGLARLSDKLS